MVGNPHLGIIPGWTVSMNAPLIRRENVTYPAAH